MVNVCTRDVVKCPSNKFVISIMKAEAIVNPMVPLEHVWIYICDLTEGGKRDHILKAVSEPVGKLVIVDVDSLAWDGPVRIEVLCHSLAEIEDLSLVFYFGKIKGARG
ncbi:hypothetical protein D1007_34778 [Hordeum vulgare]|nr:hypothetical protein D1007_34778 [Hordeum vulgare]